MAGLTAIDILINPDGGTIARARAVDARLRQSVPGSSCSPGSRTWRSPHTTGPPGAPMRSSAT